MARVRSSGNRSTEVRVEDALGQSGITGWTKQTKDIEGKPDFYFPGTRLAVFVDGCFWHGCPTCCRMPKSRQEYWTPKIQGNVRRDRAVRRRLRSRGIHVMRVWEHDLRRGTWLRRLQRMIARHATSQQAIAAAR
jgi:DNA mismatch endonuclease, patch repair protein